MKNILLVFLLLAFSAQAQRSIFFCPKVQYDAIPGPKPGSIVVGTHDAHYFYTENGGRSFRKASRGDYAVPHNTNFQMRYFFYDILPSGRTVWRDDKNGKNLYLRDKTGANLHLIGAFPKIQQFNPYDIPYFHFVTETTAYMYLTNSTRIYRTTNQGATWEFQGDLKAIVAPQIGFIRDFRFVSPLVGFALLDIRTKGANDIDNFEPVENDFVESRLARTDDGGKTWTRVAMPNGFGKTVIKGDMYFLADGDKVSIIVHGDREIFNSTNGGRSFKSHAVPSMDKWKAKRQDRGKQMVIDDVTYKPFRLIFFNL